MSTAATAPTNVQHTITGADAINTSNVTPSITRPIPTITVTPPYIGGNSILDYSAETSRYPPDTPIVSRRIDRDNRVYHTSRLHIKDIAKFSGSDNTESVSEFLFRFNHISKLNGYSDDDKLNVLPLILTGPAQTVYRNLTPTQLQSPDEILNQLVKRFNPESLRICKKAELFSTKMGENENLEQFIENLLTKSKEINLNDSDVLSIFLNNVTNPIKAFIMTNQPAALSKALSMARLKSAADIRCSTKTTPAEELIS